MRRDSELRSEKGQKENTKKNNKIYTRMIDHIGQYYLVVVSLYNHDWIIPEGSKTRRKFIDNVISRSDKDYLYTLSGCQNTLPQRNALLKNFS
ncbi:MAG: hypothetical protein ABI045_04265 [Flavobacteriales bacterium]